MELWAKNEIERICKKDNPDFDIFSDDFDYDGSCYKSAFKAYRSICSDGHSGMSYGFTKNILIKLLNEQPLTPIVDEDFFYYLNGTMQHPLESEEYLKKRGLKSHLQCPRRSSLFRYETLDGEVSYSDVDREYCFNIEKPSDTYHGFGCKFVDEIFPITMPYHPSSKKYAVACREFLVDKSHGDFDTVEVLYIETPDETKVEVNKYFTDGRNVGLETDDWTEISKEKYDELCKKRLDKVEDKITCSFLWTLKSNSHSDKENKLLEKRYKLLPEETHTKIYNDLKELVVKHIVEPQKFEYNTFNVEQALCSQNDYYKHELSKIEGLKEISEYLMSVYNDLLKFGN